LSNSFGFGGNNAAVVLSSPDFQPVNRPSSPARLLTIVGAACLTGSGGTEDSVQKFLNGESVSGTFPENGVTKDLPARQIRRLKRLPKISLSLAVAGGSAISQSFLLKSPLRLAEGQQRGYGKQYPADACGAICLSFRALARLSLKI
jgi:hypothetical protein